MDTVDRREHIQRILEDWVSVVGADGVYRNDPQYQAEVYRLIETLTMVDQAMEEEGIVREVRAKVLYTCFVRISEHEEAAARLAKYDKKLKEMLSRHSI